MNLEEDASLIALLNKVSYFNLEISSNFDSLIFNTIKNGIDHFLKLYAHLDTPPESISFVKWQRPHRTWFSPRLFVNPKATNKDPTPYCVQSFNGSTKNHLIQTLKINYFEKNESPIFFAKLKNQIPSLFLNKKGWQTFLTLLHHLRDESYWFFVTSPNPHYQGHSVFQLSMPYFMQEHDQLSIMEFIRLEPDKDFYLDVLAAFCGNNTGFLLLSHWMRDFAISSVEQKDICNRWNNYPKSLQQTNLIYDHLHPTWIHLHKIKIDSSHPLISFETKEGESKEHLYVFGNQKGFEEIAEIAKEYAFSSGHDGFSTRPLNTRRKGSGIERED